MKTRNWHVMEGHGERSLAQIGEDVEKFNRLKPVMPFAEEALDRIESKVYDSTGQLLTDDVLENFDLETLIAGLNPEQHTEILRAYIADVAVDKLDRIKTGRNFGHGKRGRLTVIENGIKVWKGFDAHNRNPSAYHQISPGTKIEGNIMLFSSNPLIGGELVLSHFLRRTSICGLVNPEDGTPRVDLDILAAN